MTKTSEPLLDPDAITGRFHVMVDKDADPADWDRAVARFLLAGPTDESSVSAFAPAEQTSVSISAQEEAEHSEPIFVAGELRHPKDVVLMEESAVLFSGGSAYRLRSGFASEMSFHG